MAELEKLGKKFRVALRYNTSLLSFSSTFWALHLLFSHCQLSLTLFLVYHVQFPTQLKLVINFNALLCSLSLSVCVLHIGWQKIHDLSGWLAHTRAHMLMIASLAV